MSYRVSLQGIELAAYTLAIGQIEPLGGRRAITVLGHARLTGIGSLIGGNIDDHFTSWLDTETGRPLRFAVDEFASKSKDIEHTVVDFAARKENKIPITFRLNDGTEQPESQIVSGSEVWDYNAFLIAARSWEGPPGTRAQFEVFRSRNLWRIVVTISGKERVTTELGELPALRFDATTFRLKRDGSRDPDADERYFTLWISDDAGRVPLQINAKTDYGEVKMQIVEYVPGSGAQLGGS